VELEKVRWMTLVVFQWMQGAGMEAEAVIDKRVEAIMIKRKWPEAEVTQTVDSWNFLKVLCVQLDGEERAELAAAVDHDGAW
jgi:hypothetical protein